MNIKQSLLCFSCRATVEDPGAGLSGTHSINPVEQQSDGNQTNRCSWGYCHMYESPSCLLSVFQHAIKYYANHLIVGDLHLALSRRGSQHFEIVVFEKPAIDAIVEPEYIGVTIAQRPFRSIP